MLFPVLSGRMYRDSIGNLHDTVQEAIEAEAMIQDELPQDILQMLVAAKSPLVKKASEYFRHHDVTKPWAGPIPKKGAPKWQEYVEGYRKLMEYDKGTPVSFEEAEKELALTSGEVRQVGRPMPYPEMLGEASLRTRSNGPAQAPAMTSPSVTAPMTSKPSESEEESSMPKSNEVKAFRNPKSKLAFLIAKVFKISEEDAQMGFGDYMQKRKPAWLSAEDVPYWEQAVQRVGWGAPYATLVTVMKRIKEKRGKERSMVEDPELMGMGDPGAVAASLRKRSDLPSTVDAPDPYLDSLLEHIEMMKASGEPHATVEELLQQFSHDDVLVAIGDGYLTPAGVDENTGEELYSVASLRKKAMPFDPYAPANERNRIRNKDRQDTEVRLKEEYQESKRSGTPIPEARLELNRRRKEWEQNNPDTFWEEGQAAAGAAAAAVAAEVAKHPGKPAPPPPQWPSEYTPEEVVLWYQAVDRAGEGASYPKIRAIFNAYLNRPVQPTATASLRKKTAAAEGSITIFFEPDEVVVNPPIKGDMFGGLPPSNELLANTAAVLKRMGLIFNKSQGPEGPFGVFGIWIDPKKRAPTALVRLFESFASSEMAVDVEGTSLTVYEADSKRAFDLPEAFDGPLASLRKKAASPTLYSLVDRTLEQSGKILMPGQKDVLVNYLMSTFPSVADEEAVKQAIMDWLTNKSGEPSMTAPPAGPIAVAVPAGPLPLASLRTRQGAVSNPVDAVRIELSRMMQDVAAAQGKLIEIEDPTMRAAAQRVITQLNQQVGAADKQILDLSTRQSAAQAPTAPIPSAVQPNPASVSAE